MLEDINKIPDPEFESKGFSGWYYFKREFEDIKRDYDRYGDIVLEKRLGKSIEIYKAAFASENFLKAIRDIWTERYHYVANSLGELIAFYEMADKENLFLGDLLPNVFPHNPGETDGRNQVFALSRQLYEDILSKANRNRLLILKGKKVYELTVNERGNGTFYKIRVDQIEVLEVQES